MADKEQAKRGKGRPRTTTDDLPKSWKNIMIKAGKAGKTEVQMRVLLGIGDSAWYTLKQDSEDFRLTLKKANALAQAFWEDRLEEGIVGNNPDMNATLAIFMMKNRFREYSDRKEKEDRPATPLSISFDVNPAKRDITITRGEEE